jgi:hypothetical protein
MVQELATKALSDNLNSAYRLNTWVKKNKEKPVIAVSGKEYSKTLSILCFVCSRMRYC